MVWLPKNRQLIHGFKDMQVKEKESVDSQVSTQSLHHQLYTVFKYRKLINDN